MRLFFNLVFQGKTMRRKEKRWMAIVDLSKKRDKSPWVRVGQTTHETLRGNRSKSDGWEESGRMKREMRIFLRVRQFFFFFHHDTETEVGPDETDDHGKRIPLQIVLETERWRRISEKTSTESTEGAWGGGELWHLVSGLPLLWLVWIRKNKKRTPGYTQYYSNSISSLTIMVMTSATLRLPNPHREPCAFI